jgi:hypothetical protein
LSNTSNFPLKISTPVIQFSGGWLDMLSSQICFALLVISYAFLVSRSYTFIFFLHETSLCQVLLLLLSRSCQQEIYVYKYTLCQGRLSGLEVHEVCV